jgi:DNA-binding NarL/FixJ family response regulator
MLSRSAMRCQIVELLVQGKSRKEISNDIQRSQHTVDTHIKALYRGVGVGDRAQLIVIAVLLFRFGASPPELGTVHEHSVAE